MFVKAHLERPACMAKIFLFAIREVKLVNATFFRIYFVMWEVLFHGQVFSDGVVGGILDPKRCFFEQFCNIPFWMFLETALLLLKPLSCFFI